MKKIFIFKIILCVAIIIATISMSACSDEGIGFVLDMDSKQLTITIPTEKLSADADGKLLQYDSVTLKKGTNLSDIVIDLSEQTDGTESQNEIMNVVASILPDYNSVLNGLSISIEKNFFGTSLFGSEYFSISIHSPHAVSVPFKIVFSKDFMLDGLESAYDKNVDRYILSTDLELESGSNQLEMQYNTCDYKSIDIEIDITDGSPMVLYHIVYDARDAQAIKNQLTSIGMTVESCDESRASFSETFETCDDFKHVFPIRTFTLFDCVTTVDYQFSSFFSDKCSVSFVFKDMNNKNISLIIKSQEKTEFMLIQDSQQKDITGDSLDLQLYGDVEIRAEYNNARWFESTTSILTIIIIAVVLAALIFLVKKRF